VTLTSRLIATAASAYVPDFPKKLLADLAVLQHPSVIAALETVGNKIMALYVSITRDRLGVAIASVHGTLL
jgi:hypothetical protein